MNKEEKRQIDVMKEFVKTVAIAVFFAVFTFLCIAVVFSSHTY